MPATEDLTEWIRLEQTSGVGPDTARRLLGEFGLPVNIFSANLLSLQKIVPERIAHALLAPISNQTQALIEKTLAWAEQPENRILTLADVDYPKALLDIADPPLLLYIKGRIELLSNTSLAIVGSRNATAQGIANAEKFSEAMSEAGLTIVSGMALGIDTAAHQGSLRCSDKNTAGSTIAVIGTGADIVYPARNRALAHRIAQGGCIVSEYPLGMPAIAGNFPRRNRIISGLACGVLVIEAAAQSGSLITARMALDQGRDVFAIPGSIHSPLSKGCHQLIKQGAKLVESAQDILEELRPWHSPQSAITMPVQTDPTNPATLQLLTAMGFDPVDVNRLAERTALDICTLNSHLLNLELDGLIEMLPGGIYRRLS